MSKIKAVTKDKKLIIVSRPVLTSGSKNIDELSVVFDKTWNFDSAEYYVNFYIDDEKNGTIRNLNVIGNVGRCDIPFYITKTDGFFHFGVFAKADDDIIKTTDVVGYEVEKGICINPDGDEHDTAAEIKKLFIDMINNNVDCSCLDYDMRFEDIEMNFYEYMMRFREDMIVFSDLCDDYYNIIKEYVDTDIQKINGAKDALLTYNSILAEYFAENGIQFELDSISDEVQELDSFKDGILNLITTYIDNNFNEGNDLMTYISKIEEQLINGAEAAECCNEIISDLNELYTGGDSNAT